jgi:hypothetical protein
VTTYVTGYGSRTHIAKGDQVVVETRYRHERYWNTLCGVTADDEAPPTNVRPLCKRCERKAQA